MRRGRGGHQGGRGGHRNGGGGRHGGGGRGHNHRGGRGRYSRGGGHYAKGQSAESGNQRERIAVESGFLVLIDQFMLANPQFLEQLSNLADDAIDSKDDLVRSFGGEVIELEPGTYRIDRDPFAPSIVIHQSASQEDGEEAAGGSSESVGTVFVDTRCLAMIDRELLDDRSLLDRYQQLWFSGQEKACRDLLRDNGGAVRYGFNRFGDELNVLVQEEPGLVCLRPVDNGSAAAPSE